MKARLAILAVLSLLPCSCGFVGKTLSTVTAPVSGLLNTVTGPLRGLTNLAEDGSEKAWREKADELKRLKNSPTAHDCSRTPVQRRN